MEDKIIDAIIKLTLDNDFSNIDRVEINLVDGVVDINIESSEDNKDVELDEMFDTEDDIETKTMAMAIMVSSFGTTFCEFIIGVDKHMSASSKWAAAFNTLFSDMSKKGKKDYLIQVIPA